MDNNCKVLVTKVFHFIQQKKGIKAIKEAFIKKKVSSSITLNDKVIFSNRRSNCGMHEVVSGFDSFFILTELFPKSFLPP